MTQAAAHSTPRIPGTPCWVSLMVHGLGTTEDFYTALFGWEFVPGPDQLGPYVRALLDGKEVAGIGRLTPDRHLQVTWTPYLATDDADATAETIRACGGTVAVGPLDAGTAGRVAICADPLGAVFGIWQAGDHPGTRLSGVPGTPVWNELITQECSAVTKFYETVFGHEARACEGAEPGEDHRTLHLGAGPVASVLGVGRALPHDRGPHWMISFLVADSERAAEVCEANGGRVLHAPDTSQPGRPAVLADPEGAVFTVLETPPTAIAPHAAHGA
ncbi:VOC family protein [Streptomyces sp. BI20]|uniref:VOC family protein n=1 Tax=Streptomyces sp. BI20 TaxID=3403460 RepID=UPI003C782E20